MLVLMVFLIKRNPEYNSETNLDPNNDDYIHYDDLGGQGDIKYYRMNKTEDNGRLDTEDLNRSGSLNKKNRYLELRIDLENLENYATNDNIEVENWEKEWKYIRLRVNTETVKSIFRLCRC